MLMSVAISVAKARLESFLLLGGGEPRKFLLQAHRHCLRSHHVIGSRQHLLRLVGDQIDLELREFSIEATVVQTRVL